MSQPPQYPADGAGSPPPDPYGPSSASAGSESTSNDYSQPSSNGYSQSSAGGYSQASAKGYSQASANGYSQPSPNGYSQASANGYSQPSPNGYSQGSANAPGQPPAYSAPGGSFAPQPPPAKKSRWWLWTCLGCGVLGLILLLVIGGCSVLASRGGDDGTTTEAPISSTSAPADPASSAAPATSAAAPAPGAGDPGSKDNPLPLGQGPVTIATSDGGTLDVTLGAANWDAWAAIQSANSFNEPPPEGQVYVMVPVTVTYHGSGSANVWIESSIKYAPGNGQIYTEASVVTPRSSINTNEVTEGGTAEYDIAFLVPADQVRVGQFTVEPLMSFNGETFYYAAS